MMTDAQRRVEAEDIAREMAEADRLSGRTRLASSPRVPAEAAQVIEPHPIIVRLADVQPEPVQWLWLARLALGKLTLLIGDPGLGKSWITLYIAAMLSTGRCWPDGSVPPRLVNTLLLTAEDGLSDTIRPRLDVLGADVSRIHHLAILRAGDKERAIQLADVPMIEQAMIETDARLLVVDPVSAYVGATDSHKDAPVRGLLAPLGAMLERRGAAGLAVMHLRKNANGPALHRTGGSIAFAAAARIVLAVAEDHERGGRRVFASVKQNLTADPPPLEYSLGDGRFAWADGPVENVDINVLLSGPVRHGERGEQTDAEQLLRELLSDESEWPMDAKTAKAAGEAHGIHERTLRRAASRMGIEIRRVGFGASGRWVWHRPANADSTADTPDRADAVSPMSAMTEQPRNSGHTHIGDTKNPFTRAREACDGGADGDYYRS